MVDYPVKKNTYIYKYIRIFMYIYFYISEAPAAGPLCCGEVLPVLLEVDGLRLSFLYSTHQIGRCGGWEEM